MRKTYSLSLDIETVENARTKAELEGRTSFSGLVDWVLNKYLNGEIVESKEKS